ncbi:MAG: oligosaccharide flippase family protein, partial [Alphaproteobacteria bacterium]|nr:oligosaccharide flippase family protein [Alphaproteobacteria bacterium]
MQQTHPIDPAKHTALAVAQEGLASPDLPAPARSYTTIQTIKRQVRETLFASGERHLAKRDAAIAFSVRVAGAALLYLTQIFLARWMGGFDYGVYVVVWTWVLVLGGLAPLGIDLAVIRLLPEYKERREFDLARGLLRSSRLFALTAGTLVAGVGVLVLSTFEGLLSDYYLLPAYLVLIAIPMFCLTDAQDGIGRAQSWMAVALIPPYILRPLLLLAGMALAHSIGLPLTAATAAAAAIAATWMTAIIQAIMIRWRLPQDLKSGPRQYSFKPWMVTSLPLAVMVACDLALQNIDVLVISRFMSPVDVGIYFAAAKTMSLIMFVHYAVGSATANRFATLNARGDSKA